MFWRGGARRLRGAAGKPSSTGVDGIPEDEGERKAYKPAEHDDAAAHAVALAANSE